jgi:hypothetical protein
MMNWVPELYFMSGRQRDVVSLSPLTIKQYLCTMTVAFIATAAETARVKYEKGESRRRTTILSARSKRHRLR